MLTDDKELMRALRPKITPQAAGRMYMQHMTGIAATTGTLGVLWWQAYWKTMADVLFPQGAK